MHRLPPNLRSPQNGLALSHRGEAGAPQISKFCPSLSLEFSCTTANTASYAKEENQDGKSTGRLEIPRKGNMEAESGSKERKRRGKKSRFLPADGNLYNETNL